MTFTAQAARRLLLRSGLCERDAYDLLADNGHDPAAVDAPPIPLERLIHLVADNGPFTLTIL